MVGWGFERGVKRESRGVVQWNCVGWGVVCRGGVDIDVVGFRGDRGLVRGWWNLEIVAWCKW